MVNLTKQLAKKILTHSGPIHSAVAGRTDHLPMHVKPGAYIFPADVTSALGEGNTTAGFKVIKGLFNTPYIQGTPYGATGLPYGAAPADKADGGPADVPIIAAGGEYALDPEYVMHVGNGNLDDGHAILDHFVKQVRAKYIKKLSSLPGPRKD